MRLIRRGLTARLGHLFGRLGGRERLARLGRGAASWRPHFARSRSAHFPPSANLPPRTSLGGTTVVEDSAAAVLGTPVAPRPESERPEADRPEA